MKTLGIELGSTRIKAVVIDGNYKPVSSGEYGWKSEQKNGYWTYSLDEVWTGLKSALNGMDLKDLDAFGVSGMMHGYLAFDKDWNLLVPFRTWQNTTTGEAAAKLTSLFNFNIPQRWSIAHLYQAILNNEEHVDKIAHITTLAGYVHYMLTGSNVVGVGEASGMFPIDSETNGYNQQMLRDFDEILGRKWRIEELLPAIKCAGEKAGEVSASGSKLLAGALPEGLPAAPPEGDAGTGMTATCSVAARTGNVSAGTSIFSMVVLEKLPATVHEEIDLVVTPAGDPVAMVHCNNCTQDLNAWVQLLGGDYEKLFKLSLEGEADCAGVVSCNYYGGEGVTHLNAGKPLVTYDPVKGISLANFVRSMIYSSMATLKIGMDVLSAEGVSIDSLTAHGGLFKTPGVAQSYLAAATGSTVNCMESAGEGGPYGMALLAAYMCSDSEMSLARFLSEMVFKGVKSEQKEPEAAMVSGFNTYIEGYQKLLEAERTLVC